MDNLIILSLHVGLWIMAIIGFIGYFYVLSRSSTEAFRKGFSKPIIKYILFGWSLTLLTCLSLSVLVVLWTQYYAGGPNLLKLSLIASLFPTLIIIIRCLFGNLLHKKVGKYFGYKNGNPRIILEEKE